MSYQQKLNFILIKNSSIEGWWPYKKGGKIAMRKNKSKDRIKKNGGRKKMERLGAKCKKMTTRWQMVADTSH